MLLKTREVGIHFDLLLCVCALHEVLYDSLTIVGQGGGLTLMIDEDNSQAMHHVISTCANLGKILDMANYCNDCMHVPMQHSCLVPAFEATSFTELTTTTLLIVQSLCLVA